MSPLDSLLQRLARPEDSPLLIKPSWSRRLRLIARISWRYLWVYLALLAVAVVWVGASGMDVYHRTEMPQFCNTCHEMGRNFDTWESSRHGGIRCIDCHARPGLSGYVAAKTAGLAQLYAHLTAKDISDIHLERQHREIVSENCVRCHPETARAADRHSRVMAHKRHGELGLGCVTCHSGSVAHPTPREAKDPLAGIVATEKCFECHDGKHTVVVPGGKARSAFSAVAPASCTQCHPDAEFGKEHGGGSECLDCHEVATGQVHFQLDKQNQAALCEKCHDAPARAASTHRPVAQGKCDECHRVMAPAYLFRFGPSADKDFCLACHPDVAGALALPQAATLTQFADGRDDRHRSHLDDIGDSPALCRSCHAGHASPAARGLVSLHSDDDADPPGQFTATESGGSCTGACHGDETVTYDRRVPALTAPVAPPRAPTATEETP